MKSGQCVGVGEFFDILQERMLQYIMNFVSWFNDNQGFTSALLAIATLLISIIAIVVSLNTSRRQNIISLKTEYSSIINMLWKIESLSHRFFGMLSRLSPDDNSFIETVNRFNSGNNFDELLEEVNIITARSEQVLSKPNHDTLTKIQKHFYLLNTYVYCFSKIENKQLNQDEKEILITTLSSLNDEVKSLYAKLIKQTRIT